MGVSINFGCWMPLSSWPAPLPRKVFHAVGLYATWNGRLTPDRTGQYC
jgi:hypothetical protein